LILTLSGKINTVECHLSGFDDTNGSDGY